MSSDEINRQFRLRNKIDISEEIVRSLIKNTVKDIAIKFHNDSLRELNDWIASQSPPATHQQISLGAKAIWEDAVLVNTQLKIKCWPKINGNRKIIDKDKEYFASLHLKINNMETHIVKKEAEINNLMSKDENTQNDFDIMESLVNQIEELKKEVQFLKSPFINYQPSTYWDTMRIMISESAYFNEDMNCQDMSNLLLMIEKMTSKTSLSRNNLAIVREARNTWAHKRNLTKEQVQDYIKSHRDFTKSFLKEFSSCVPPTSEVSIDDRFDLISFDAFHQLNLRSFPSQSAFYVGDQFTLIKEVLNSRTSFSSSSSSFIDFSPKFPPSMTSDSSPPLSSLASSALPNTNCVLISGLGGLGKTEMANQFRIKEELNYPGGVFWVDANSTAAIQNSLIEISPSTSSDDKWENCRFVVIDLIKKANSKCLLVFDNADSETELKFILDEILHFSGFKKLNDICDVIVTTRISQSTSIISTMGQCIEIKELSEYDSVKTIYCFKTSISEPIIPVASDLEYKYAHKLAWQHFGGLPLAIKGAGVYMCNNKITFEQYLKIWEQQSIKLLEDALAENVDRDIDKHVEIMLSKAGKSGKILDRLMKLSKDVITNSECKTISEFKKVLENKGCIDDYDMKDSERKSLLRVVSDGTKREINERNIWITWEISMKIINIETDRLGETLMQLCSLVAPDNIPFIYFNGAETNENVNKALDSLERYSLIDIKNKGEAKEFISLHRLVHAVTKQKLKKDEVKDIYIINKAVPLMLKNLPMDLVLNTDFDQTSLRNEWREWFLHGIFFLKGIDIHLPLHSCHVDSVSNIRRRLSYFQSLEFNLSEFFDELVLPLNEDWKCDGETSNLNILYYLHALLSTKIHFKKAHQLFLENKDSKLKEENLANPLHKILSKGTTILLFKELSLFDDAVKILTDILTIQKEILSLPANHPSIATTYNSIGSMYESQRKCENAMENFNLAFDIRKKNLPKNHASIALSHLNIGFVYYLQDKHKEALESYNAALTIYKLSLPDNHPEIAGAYNNIGLVYYERGKQNEALKSFNAALDIYKNSLPSNHPNVAITYNNIGLVYVSQGKQEEALKTFDSALAINKEVFSINHPSVAGAYFNIGSVYSNLGRYKEALESFHSSLVIQKQIWTANHTDIGASYNNIGNLFIQMGLWHSALQFEQGALSVNANNGNEESVNVCLKAINMIEKMIESGVKPSLSEMKIIDDCNEVTEKLNILFHELQAKAQVEEKIERERLKKEEIEKIKVEELLIENRKIKDKERIEKDKLRKEEEEKERVRLLEERKSKIKAQLKLKKK